MTQFQKLQQVVDEPKLYKVQRNSKLYFDIKALLSCGQVHTYKVTRSKGYTNISDTKDKICGILDSLNIAYEVSNDAPRGGKQGTFIMLTGKAILRDIRNSNH